MSIASEITRLQVAKSDLKTSIENKGVTVPASTLISGYSALVDQIITGGLPNIQALNITANGTYTASGSVDGYSPITVSVSGGGLEYETGTWTPTSDISRGTITFSNTHTYPPALYTISDATGTLNPTKNSALFNAYCDVYRLWGVGFPVTSTDYRYAVVTQTYRGSSGATHTVTYCSVNSDDTGSESGSYPRYWATPTEFHPYVGATTRYWRVGKTYKWIAIWV